MKLCDRLFRMTHSKEVIHNRRLWPHLRKVDRDSTGAITNAEIWPTEWKLELTPFDAIEKPHTSIGHIILSGPSINDIDYNRLSLPFAMGVNGSFVLSAKYNIKFKYYVIIDSSFVCNQLELTRQIVASDLILFARVDVLKEINLRIPKSDIRCRFVAFEEVDTPVYKNKPSVANLMEKACANPAFTLFDGEKVLGFSEDITLGVFGARTVAYDALQIMVWLGITEIYFHGLDMGNSVTAPRFYENAETKTKTTLHRNFHEVIEPAFSYAGAYLRERGIAVWNLSPHSAISDTIFPKKDWTSLIK